MVQACILCLNSVDFPLGRIPICLRCHKELQLIDDPQERMAMAVKAYNSLQTRNLNMAIACLAKKLAEAIDTQAVDFESIFEPGDN